jgi:hypothetical protein
MISNLFFGDDFSIFRGAASRRPSEFVKKGYISIFQRANED